MLMIFGQTLFSLNVRKVPKLKETEDIQNQIDEYIIYFNFGRPQSCLNYLTLMEFKQSYEKL